MKRRTIIDGGAVCYEIESTLPRRSDGRRERAARSKATSQAQATRNRILSTRQLELILSKNFPVAGSALVAVLTYDDDHLPKSRKEAQLRFRYFLRKLRDARTKAGLPEPRVVYCPEVLSSRTGRWHHHIVLDATGDDIAMIRRCWIYGSDIQGEKLRVDEEKNHETLASYMNKELREAQEYECRPGLHGWGCTRSCQRPEVDTVIVEDSDRLKAPRGATVLMQERRESEFATFAVIKYRLPDRCFRKGARARRRRR